MKTQSTNYWKRLLALIALLMPLLVTGPALGDDEGVTPQLTAQWWQWSFSIPSSVHALSQKCTDPTGAEYCMVGQQGEYWFLGGVFKIIEDDSVESQQAQSEENGGIYIEKVERECHDIPLGTTILIPVLNAECNTAEELALGNSVPQGLRPKTKFLRDCVMGLADAVDNETATAYFGPVDSKGNWTQNSLEVQRVYTDLPFFIVYSPDNILSSDCEPDDPEPFLCDPVPNPSLAMADGYWAHVRPSKPGTYKLQTYGEVPYYNWALSVTYTLTVVATDNPKDQ